MMYRRILVPVDGSPTSDKGLDEAIKLAKLTGAQLKLVHVIDELQFATGFETSAAYTQEILPFVRTAGEAILAQCRDRAGNSGVPVATLLLERLAARVSELVIEQANVWNADLIVIGTHGRRGFDRLLLGSDAERILRLAPVPVLLVRAPEVEPPR